YTVIDPKHNPFLGTAKYCMQYWPRNNILSKQDIELMEQCMSHFLAPHSVGRLPLKIFSGFSGFSADQFEAVNGNAACSHVHMHLKNCLQDYGPLHAFKCYAFER
uniref:Uncharacterized protein n=1 Tax=Amphimedon queenslandica TaxID=400682 RepID=A0A1X7SYW1_AMPQE